MILIKQWGASLSKTGIDGKTTARDLAIEERNKKAYFLKNGFHRKNVSDGGLTMCEIHNPNSFAVKMIRMNTMIGNLTIEQYINSAGITLGAREITIPPLGFAILTHQYYIPVGVGLPDGEPLNLVINYGRMIGIGNRFPSRFE